MLEMVEECEEDVNDADDSDKVRSLFVVENLLSVLLDCVELDVI